MSVNNDKYEAFIGDSDKKSDDGCIGNRRIRTICLSLILLAFGVMGMAYLFNERQAIEDSKEVLCDTVEQIRLGLSAATGTDYELKCDAKLPNDNPLTPDGLPPLNLGIAYNYYEDAMLGFNLAISGAFIFMAACLMAIALSFCDCKNTGDRLAGIVFVVGGALYLIGWIFYVAKRRQFAEDVGRWDELSDEAQTRSNAQGAAIIGEAALPAITAVLLGIDAFMHLFDNEHGRLFANLSNLCVVSLLCCPTYFILSDDLDKAVSESLGSPNSSAYPWIASGYALMACFTALYMILYLFTCCTCNAKDGKCMRLIMVLGLLGSGALIAIGYYIFAGSLQVTDDSKGKSQLTDDYFYYIGYTVMIAGSTLVWVLDIGIDDFK